MFSLRLALVPLALAALAGCGSPQEAAKEPQSEAPAAASPVAATSTAEASPATAETPPEFAQCAACHTVKPGVNAVGPSLAGVVGRKAGTLPGFAYSDAMKASGLTWDEATLDSYLTAPMQKVPGTRMIYAGLPDAAKRKALIEFLKSAK